MCQGRHYPQRVYIPTFTTINILYKNNIRTSSSNTNSSLEPLDFDKCQPAYNIDKCQPAYNIDKCQPAYNIDKYQPAYNIVKHYTNIRLTLSNQFKQQHVPSPWVCEQTNDWPWLIVIWYVNKQMIGPD